MPILLGGPSIALFTFRNEQLRVANEQLQTLATYDWMTSCLNRGAFTHKVTRILETTTLSAALLVVDVDHFKSINDNHGHDRGDDALRLIAGTLRETMGDRALVGRLGGEEFGIFLTSISPADLARIAERLRAAVARLAFVTDGVGCPLSISIGGTIVRGKSDFRALYRLADMQLYEAKAAGRDRVSLIEAA
ncbi:hypothetical protein VE26_11500 [Devosia chinhatensis]|uniref:diguanylate cyclase n=2 Tax=Devosia chinhatensis TaxID=429727 RepID=A0A0F5FI38_9HYPH|nr:hypothetical protein VE26_11500 [Devosia chinhatensis]